MLARRKELDEFSLHPVGGAITNVGANPVVLNRIGQSRFFLKLLTVLSYFTHKINIEIFHSAVYKKLMYYPN